MSTESLTHDDYYALLMVPHTATQEQIAQSYKKIAFENHPDKCKSEDGVAHFTKCSQAYDVLSDQISRALYDMVIGVRPESNEERKRINRLKREDAKKALALMEETVSSRRDEEEFRDGLIVLEAVYGDLAGIYKRHAGTINVTVPLQCMVDSSTLIIHGGSSKSWLEGFFDPSEGGDNELYVRYKFLNKLHECTVGDTEELCMPMQEHLIDERLMRANGSGLMKYKEKRREMKTMKKRKKRRRFFLFTALAAVLGFFFARRTSSFQNLKMGDMGITSPLILRLLGSQHA